MKSVGEVMAIGRTFAESLQKALRSMETGLTGLDDVALEGLGHGDDKNVDPRRGVEADPRPHAEGRAGLRLGFDVEQVYQYCSIDPWFLAQLKGNRRHGSARARARAAERRASSCAR